MNTRWIAIIAPIALLTLGCAVGSNPDVTAAEAEWTFSEPTPAAATTPAPNLTAPPPYAVDDSTFGALDVQNSWVGGDMGQVRDFRGGVWLEEGWHEQWVDQQYSVVTVQSKDAAAGWATMTILDIMGGIGHEALRPGAHLRFDQVTYPIGDEALYISVVGCSGDAPNEWDFDTPADEVLIDVSQGPSVDSLRLRFTARFGSQFVNGSVDVSTGTVRPL